MKRIDGLILGAGFALGGCTVATGSTGVGPNGYLKEVPEAVLEIAAPYQNLDAVVLKPEDGCYWYRHDGPVESTLLPLRTRSGNPICTRAQG